MRFLKSASDESCNITHIFSTLNQKLENGLHSSSLTRSLHSLLGKVIVNQIKSNSSHYAGFLTYHFPLREQMIRSHTFDKCGKSLIQPEVVPPFHSDQITKPLKERTANYCNPMFICAREIFARFARASSSQLFLTGNQFSNMQCKLS